MIKAVTFYTKNFYCQKNNLFYIKEGIEMRSDLIKEGPSRAPHRSLLRALGIDELEMKRPFIAVVNSKSDYIPGHMHLDKIAEQVKAGIKKGLEGLAGQIPGLIEVKVRTECLPSSTADVMLDTTFDSVESLKGYAVNPKHVAVADSKVRPYTAVRSCMDYEI